MSEIKGQLLGVILVLIIFGAVATTMGVVFKNSLSTVSTKYNDTIDTTEDSMENSGAAAAPAPAGLHRVKLASYLEK